MTPGACVLGLCVACAIADRFQFYFMNLLYIVLGLGSVTARAIRGAKKHVKLIVIKVFN